MVMLKAPVEARLPTVSVSVLEAVAGFGLNEAETRFGKPEAENVTPSVKPLAGAMLIADWPRLPRATPRLAGEAARLKFGPGVTVSETTVELAKGPEVPLTVIG